MSVAASNLNRKRITQRRERVWQLHLEGKGPHAIAREVKESPQLVANDLRVMKAKQETQL